MIGLLEFLGAGYLKVGPALHLLRVEVLGVGCKLLLPLHFHVIDHSRHILSLFPRSLPLVHLQKLVAVAPRRISGIVHSVVVDACASKNLIRVERAVSLYSHLHRIYQSILLLCGRSWHFGTQRTVSESEGIIFSP